MTNNNSKDPNPPKPLTPQEKKRVAKCQRAIQRALTRHKCLLTPRFVIMGTAITTSIHILPRPS